MRAILLDRDGVICENRTDHVKSWEEFKFLPGAKTALAALSELDLPIIVITNQAAIGRGLVTAGVVDGIHRRMVAEVESDGGRIDRVVYCPHRARDRCACRKPEPGMLFQMASEMGIDLSQSYLVGDAATDLLAGQRVGCQLFLVLTGRGRGQLVPSLRSVHSFRISQDLLEAANHILRTEANLSHKDLAAMQPATPTSFQAERYTISRSTQGG
jgi:D-glycero-D-manno-heptose 1,7-bisphosphate phosphatase